MFTTGDRWGPGRAVIVQGRRNRRVWLAKRRHLLGATDATAVLGYHPTRTPLDVWLDKTGQAGPDRVHDTYQARRGHALEALLLEQWAVDEGATLEPVPPLLRHATFPHVGVSLDGAGTIGGQLHIVDAKTAGWVKRDDWWDNPDDAPDHYVGQVLLQLAVTGAETGWLAADVAGQYMCVGPIPRDPVWEQWALPTLEAWWETHITGHTPPDPDPVRDYPNINRAWVPDPGEALTAEPDHLELVRRYRSARTLAKLTAAAADESKGRLRVAMGTASRLLVDVGQDAPVRAAYIDGRGALCLPRRDPLELIYSTTEQDTL